MLLPLLGKRSRCRVTRQGHRDAAIEIQKVGAKPPLRPPDQAELATHPINKFIGIEMGVAASQMALENRGKDRFDGYARSGKR